MKMTPSIQAIVTALAEVIHDMGDIAQIAMEAETDNGAIGALATLDSKLGDARGLLYAVQTIHRRQKA